MSMPATRFARLGRGPALLIIAVTAAALVVCLVVALIPTAAAPVALEETGSKKPGSKPEQSQAPASPQEFNPEDSDWLFYQRVVAAVRSGKNYYEVVPAELKKIKFQPFSVFNYRPPLYAWFLAAIPEVCAQLLLGTLALAALATAFAALQREVGPKAACAGVLLIASGLLWFVVPVAIYAHELWTGVFLTMSVSAYALGHRLPGMAAALVALFLRELTLPYCLIAAFIAARQRQRTEIVGWVIGFATYAAYMAAHFRAVTQIMPPQTTRSTLEWLQYGGIPFLLSTTQMNFLLLLLPKWLTAVYLPLALLGLSSWKGEMGTRVLLTVTAYTAGFSLVGQVVNGYWGLVDAPLLALGLLWLPAALRDLFQDVCRPQRSGDAQSADDLGSQLAPFEQPS
jgi:predicted membrane channel-forming protein YqfA (hemolysin III family)